MKIRNACLLGTRMSRNCYIRSAVVYDFCLCLNFRYSAVPLTWKTHVYALLIIIIVVTENILNA